MTNNRAKNRRQVSLDKRLPIINDLIDFAKYSVENSSNIILLDTFSEKYKHKIRVIKYYITVSGLSYRYNKFRINENTIRALEKMKDIDFFYNKNFKNSHQNKHVFNLNNSYDLTRNMNDIVNSTFHIQVLKKIDSNFRKLFDEIFILKKVYNEIIMKS